MPTGFGLILTLPDITSRTRLLKKTLMAKPSCNLVKSCSRMDGNWETPTILYQSKAHQLCFSQPNCSCLVLNDKHHFSVNQQIRPFFESFRSAPSLWVTIVFGVSKAQEPRRNPQTMRPLAESGGWRACWSQSSRPCSLERSGKSAPADGMAGWGRWGKKIRQEKQVFDGRSVYSSFLAVGYNYYVVLSVFERLHLFEDLFPRRSQIGSSSLGAPHRRYDLCFLLGRNTSLWQGPSSSWEGVNWGGFRVLNPCKKEVFGPLRWVFSCLFPAHTFE